MTSRRILLLGAPRVERDGHWVQIGRRKAVGLLAYLTVTRTVFTREALAELFWADAELSRGLAYLRTTLWTLNQALGDDWAQIEQDTVAFNPASGIWDDVSTFRALAGERNEQHLSEGVALYRGDFLAGFNLIDSAGFEEWQFFQRESLRREYTASLERLIVYHSAREEAEIAINYARRWLMIDPLHEPTHRWLMRLYIDSGQRAAAIRQYQELARLLQTELQVEPEAATAELYRDVLAWRVTEDIPAVVSVPAPAEPQRLPSNLPHQTTPFVGRARELAEIQRLLHDPDCRLLTVCAPGGMGKTRLAIQAAAQSDFPDGAYFVSLAPVRSVDFLIPALIESLLCYSETPADTWRQLLDYLRDKQLLLVLDNFEHLLDGADMLPELLAAAPGVKLLVTSRERLNLREEWVFELRGLDYPVNGSRETLEAYGAVRLFIQGARRLRPNFELMDGDLAMIARICQLVDGMPLGLELASAWAQLLSVEEIARQIENSLDFLSTSVRNVPERHRSVRAIFEHSWGNLTPVEQSCLSQLSIFYGAFSLEAAQSVADASLYLLLALVNKSLLRRNSDGRFELHELLRQFAEGKLPAEHRSGVADRHAAYFADFLAGLLPALKDQRQPEALNSIQMELDDIRGAWQHSVHRGRWMLVNRMFEPMMQFALARYRYRDMHELIMMALQALRENAVSPEERRLLARLLAMDANYAGQTEGIETALRIAAQSMAIIDEYPDHPDAILPLIWIGSLRDRPGQNDPSASELVRRAIDLAEASGDKWSMAYGYVFLGWQRQNHIRYAEAQHLFHQGLKLFRELGQPLGMSLALDGLDENYRTLGDYATARTVVEEMIKLVEPLGNPIRLAYLRSRVELHQNDFFKKDLWAKTLRDARENGDKASVAWNLYHGGWIALHEERYDDAEAMLDEALKLFRELGDVEGESWTLVFQGQLYVGKGECQRARELATAAINSVAHIDFPWPVAGAHYLLGEIALAEGKQQEAYGEYHHSLEMAYRIQSIIQDLRHLSGLAALMIQKEDYELAAVIVTFLYQHPVSARDTRKRAEKLLTHLRQYLSSDAFQRAEEQAKAHTLDSLIEMALKWQL
jgi:predicted ATPase/DNA-binding SARP family transcriptional activator